MTYYFTSITASYMAKARVLCETLKKFNKDAIFVLSIADSIPESVDLKNELFDHVIMADTLDSIGNKNIFFFKHTVTELCTALKPFIALEIIKRFNAGKIIYLDPDIAVFSELSELESMLDKYSMIFTPHQLQPEDEDHYIRHNEILFLKRGTYNLGFFAVKADGEGVRFLNWWSSRLLNYCFDDNYELLEALEKKGLLGMFTDQKWIDLVPSFFDNYHILKDPGYNVCTWNLTRRVIKLTGTGDYLVDGKPLRFFHFSGFDTKGHHIEMQKIINYRPFNKNAMLLTDWYEKELDSHGQKDFESIAWAYSKYSNGLKIDHKDRKILHIRNDLYNHFDNPFEITKGFCYFKWVRRGEYSRYYRLRKKLHLFNSFKNTVKLLFPPYTKRRDWAKHVYIIYLKIKTRFKRNPWNI